MKELMVTRSIDSLGTNIFELQFSFGGRTRILNRHFIGYRLGINKFPLVLLFKALLNE